MKNKLLEIREAVGALDKISLLQEKAWDGGRQAWAFIITGFNSTKKLEGIIKKNWPILRRDPILGKKVNF